MYGEIQRLRYRRLQSDPVVDDLFAIAIAELAPLGKRAKRMFD
jgi:hypothetical protein